MDWVKDKKQSELFPKGRIEFDPDRDVTGTRSRIHAFTANLTQRQADALSRGLHYFVSPSKEYVPAQDSKPVTWTGTVTNASPATFGWAATAVIPSPITITPPSVERTPVLYVVDTGICCFKDNASTILNTEFQTPVNATTGYLKFRQGRVAPQIGLWPVTGSGVWNVAVDTVLPTGWQGGPMTGIPTGFIDPQRDATGHGTKITSAAVGAATGICGRISGMHAEVQSIRVYSSSTTFTAAVINGISQALDAHLARGSNAPSVLLFASRTVAGFDPNLEVVLWWAWNQGIICIAAGGNDSAAYATGKYSPDSLWYPLPTAQPTSPSRFDWVAANAAPTLWPDWDDDPSTEDPRPNAPYLILVGGSNATSTNSTPAQITAGTAADAWWTPSSPVVLSPTAGSSVGPDIDILAPSVRLPCANSLLAPSDDIVIDTGTSLSAGYVAGAALAYLATRPAGTNPTTFRNWLLPATGPAPTTPNAPCYQSATATAKAGHAFPSTYSGKVPRLLINTSAKLYP